MEFNYEPELDMIKKFGPLKYSKRIGQSIGALKSTYKRFGCVDFASLAEEGTLHLKRKLEFDPERKKEMNNIIPFTYQDTDTSWERII